MGDEYVVRTHYGMGARRHKSDEEARAYAVQNWGPDEFTVHKLGPAIEPPEPREWAVVSASGETFWSDGPLTKAEVQRDLAMAEQDGSLGPYRVVRVVPEDGAQ